MIYRFSDIYRDMKAYRDNCDKTLSIFMYLVRRNTVWARVFVIYKYTSLGKILC